MSARIIAITHDTNGFGAMTERGEVRRGLTLEEAKLCFRDWCIGRALPFPAPRAPPTDEVDVGSRPKRLREATNLLAGEWANRRTRMRLFAQNGGAAAALVAATERGSMGQVPKDFIERAQRALWDEIKAASGATYFDIEFDEVRP